MAIETAFYIAFKYTMVVKFQKTRAVDHTIFSTRFLRNGSFIPEHAGRQKDILSIALSSKCVTAAKHFLNNPNADLHASTSNVLLLLSRTVLGLYRIRPKMAII